MRLAQPMLTIKIVVDYCFQEAEIEYNQKSRCKRLMKPRPLQGKGKTL